MCNVFKIKIHDSMAVDFHMANLLGKKAAFILTCSDNLVTTEKATPQQRQTTFTQMIKLALDTAIKL